MKRLEMTETSDSEAMIRNAIPVEEPNKEYQIKIEIMPQPPDEWPEGFIERTAGKWAGELERAPQGDYEERIPFDDP
jgi:hypothetical protein